MATVEKARHYYFHILNVKLRHKTKKEDVASEEYVRLFRKVYNDKIHSESSPSKHCIFRFLFQEPRGGKDTNVEYLSGTFAQFTFIHNEKWINLNNLDIDEEFKAPDGLFPDAKTTEFVFVPAAHRFCYRVSHEFSASAYSIKKFLEIALDRACDNNHFVQVDVESDRASLDAIFAARIIKKLIIDINYSNTDLGDDLKKFVEEDIKASDSKRLVIEATQKPDLSIKINNSKILKGAIEASVSNGETEATILDENDRVQKIKTSKFPRKESVHGVKSRFPQLVYEKVIKLFRRRGTNDTN